MKFRHILLLSTSIIFITFGSILIIVHHHEAILLRDSVMGRMLKVYTNFKGNPSISLSTIRPAPFSQRFTSLPRSFSYQAPFLVFTAQGNVRTRDLARYAIRYTSFWDLNNFFEKLVSINHLHGSTIKKGQAVIIPGTVSRFHRAPTRYSRPVYTRGLYLNVAAAGRWSYISSIPRLKKLGINAVVFDAKDIPGRLSYDSRVPLARSSGAARRNTIDNIYHLVRYLRSHGIYTIARLAVFRDEFMARKIPGFAITSRSTGKPFDAAGEIWCDPTSKQVQDYHLALGRELASTGIDELQLDYIRFPTGGNFSNARFAHDFGKTSRVTTITAFLQRMQQTLKGTGVFLSIDIFGIVAWGQGVDIRKTGQQIDRLAPYCDVISPMLYPSHFNNDFEGHARPGDSPYYFLKRGTEKVRKLSGDRVLVRPWLQAFPWRTTTYGPDYIIKQIRACRDADAHGYLFWNASSNFKTVYQALGALTRDSTGKE